MTISRQNKILIVFAVFLLTLGAVYYFDLLKSRRHVVLNDKVQVLHLLKNSSGKFVNHIYLKVSGHTNGSLVLSKNDGYGQPNEKFTVSGDFDLDLSGDWYSDICFIILQPADSDQGEIDIVYQFYSM